MQRRLDDRTAHAYLELIGVDARPGEVDAATLVALQRAHLAAVPYENIDIVRGSPPGIEPTATVPRILGGRGGYCFHLNGGFSALLEWLEVDVTRHLAGVWGQSAETPPGPSGNHLGLTVRLDDGGRWLVDVGLGDGPPEPMPLEHGIHWQESYRFELAASPLAPGGWRLHHDPEGWWHLVDISNERAATADFSEIHVKLSTSPESGFVKVAVVMRRPEGARLEALRGCVFTEREGADVRRRDVDTADDWWETVIDGFGLDYRGLTGSERDALWTKVRSTHEAWVDAGRP